MPASRRDAPSAAPKRACASLSARGVELEREFPFGVVRQLFEPLLVAERARGPACSTVLPAPSAAAVFDMVAARSAAATASGSSLRSRLHGLYWLTVNLTSEVRSARACDDMHWCDRPSLSFLAYIVRRLEGLPVVVVGSLRPGGAGGERGAAGRAGE